ncbi:MAG: biopolymer transporter ExbD [Prevotella sp.]|jgi:biopolymer transport protein ExbD|nr:biopolymer transporter ExbD [Prevotella sp.]MBP7098401.1 biopolymer transporter ExbD [Prevotella sp.]MBP8686799.1 biopolymer transporter ExbD [Prevotella sp.]MBP8934938.1 biopolymer transporter ExbD [Prevotella sp.]MBP9982452.1 biopolymer transporter ExbD [Prevotella sp.]MCI1731624.1 biopolymer transporter ExbD [Prevotella sp.]
MAKKESKQKKMNVRVDFTPMVDMLMLLITFFMLCTTLSKSQTMELTMPSNDKNTLEKQKNEAKASESITLYVTADNKIFYGEGIPQYSNPGWLKETTWGNDGIRKILRNHSTANGVKPVTRIELAVKELNADKAKNPKMYTDSIYQSKLSKIKGGELNDGKIPTLTIIIKPSDNASYKNMVDALDEMQILSIGTYVIDKINSDDAKLLKLKGVRL